jgi:hypothetical protein
MLYHGMLQVLHRDMLQTYEHPTAGTVRGYTHICYCNVLLCCANLCFLWYVTVVLLIIWCRRTSTLLPEQ